MSLVSIKSAIHFENDKSKENKTKSNKKKHQFRQKVGLVGRFELDPCHTKLSVFAKAW